MPTSITPARPIHLAAALLALVLVVVACRIGQPETLPSLAVTADADGA
jgi:hypothetical protein